MFPCWQKLQTRAYELFEKLRQIIVQRHLEGLGLKWVVWSHISLRQWAHEDIWNQVRIVWFHISSPTLGGRRVFETKQELFGFISLKPRGKDDIWNQARQTPSSQLSLHSADCTVGSSETQINVFLRPGTNFLHRTLRAVSSDNVTRAPR